LTPHVVAPADILIVDDHPLFSAGFAHMARALRPAWTLHMAATAAEALTVLHRLSPQLALVDVGLPGDDGFALLGSMADRCPNLPVVLMSGRDDAAMRVRARASGAAGFIAKTTAPNAVADMLDTVLQGGLAFAASPTAGMPELTLRQAEILTLLSEGCSNKEMRHRLGIAERTVRAHLTELFHLLGASSRMQAVIRGRELGLIAG
jgi:DNA-binding NarL/FixJ family response regulator